MRVKYLGKKKCFKTSTNTGLFYEFIDNICDVEDKQDIEFFSSHKSYEILDSKKKAKIGDGE